ncbi:permease prefix domain 1-containing protein [Plantactinospora sp. GCM10030261]|uniref:permease prefix domain 1-containing protein n=1 Tax=Plantactinospora sp. GCM10030261 TaxID=3273420 RepID=UPI003607E0E0
MLEPGATLIDEYVRDLDGHLRGPARLKIDLLTEVRDGLTDAAEGYQADGLSTDEAQRHALAEFGAAGRLAGEYQTEITARSVRTLAVRTLAVAAVLISTGDLTWRGSPWSATPPPAGYQLVSAAVNWLWVAALVSAVTSIGILAWLARRGPDESAWPVRLAGTGLTVALAATLVNTAVLWVWSVRLWDGALLWPPMLIGLVALVVAYGWLGSGVRNYLVGVR